MRAKYRIGAEDRIGPAANALSTEPAGFLAPDDSTGTFSLTGYGMDVALLQIQVRRRDIAFLCNLLGSYEGVAIARTLDADQGIVEMMIAPAFMETALALLDSLSQGEVPLRILNRPSADHV